ncbi:nuclear transport factor 2 family protein [uncultured Maribacter sp.]|uniref:YybH family protein n=1 Tax=uncultured Maribacter sp. TaxID=431308 RepID=UPI0030DBC664|tara:strand:- start:85 stop:573 length:489 start_codon:yes stop_codon:yes gene_type:complete
MKNFKRLFLLLFAILIFASGNAQEKTITSEKEAVVLILKKYKDALHNLTAEGTFDLFTDDSNVFEQGGVEGTYKNYIAHHLGPELGHFEKFDFSDYTIETEVSSPYAFTTETYVYTIVLKPKDGKEARTIHKKGVATSVLKKINGEWKIIKTHSSSRNVKSK